MMKQTKSFKKMVAFIAVLAMVMSNFPMGNVRAEDDFKSGIAVNSGESCDFEGNVLIIKQAAQNKIGVAVWTPTSPNESQVLKYIRENSTDGSIKNFQMINFTFLHRQ